MASPSRRDVYSRRGKGKERAMRTVFANLAFYAEAFVPNEKERCRRFQEGLRDSIRSVLVPMEIADYGALVQKARLMEIDAEKTQRRRDFAKKRSSWSSSSSTAKPCSEITCSRKDTFVSQN
ncbi:hypothetical protein KSP39_PZI004434 [Platanthera zijinensis]|uniref:Uncharacterized protein n=1 Tax=Platanthera zijinensis TaxID=2320716 RepID=A0AAP0GDF0_9ASPA